MLWVAGFLWFSWGLWGQCLGNPEIHTLGDVFSVCVLLDFVCLFACWFEARPSARNIS